MADRWQVKVLNNEIYEYEGEVRTVYGGALRIVMDNGDQQIWGPSSWIWAKCVSEEKPEVAMPSAGPAALHVGADVQSDVT
jgi:hypothetical protein